MLWLMEAAQAKMVEGQYGLGENRLSSLYHLCYNGERVLTMTVASNDNI